MNGQLRSIKAQSPVKQPEREKPNTTGRQGKSELQAPLMLSAPLPAVFKTLSRPDWTDKPSAHPPTRTSIPLDD